jgi:hypothetical protein
MPSFQKTLQGASFPGMNFDFPRPDTSAGTIIETAGKLGREAYAGHIEKGMVGENRDYTREELTQAALDDKELNLRKVKQMREQGLISASGARVMANQAVQSASARLPGRASEFRQMAAAFFGDFGEGQDLLKETAAEKAKGEIEQAMKKQAALKGYGYLDANGNLVQTAEQVNTFFSIVRGSFHNEAEMSNLAVDFERGKATTATAVEFANRTVRKTLLDVMGQINGKLTRDGTLFNPEELNALMSSSQQVAESQMDAFLNDPKRTGLVTPQMRSAARSEIESMYKNMRSFVTSQSFATLMKERREGVQDLFKIYSYNALPHLAIAREAGGDQGVKFFTEYAPKFAKMNENQRNALLSTDPAARNAWNTAIAADRIHRSYGNVIQGFLPRGGMDRMVTQDAAAWTMTQPVAESADQNNKSHALDILRQSAQEGETEKLKVLTFPEAAKNATPKDQEAVLNLMATEWAGHRTTTATLLAPQTDSVSGQSIKSHQRILYDRNTGRYVLAYTPRGASLAGRAAPNMKVNGEDVVAINTKSVPLAGVPGVPTSLIHSVQNMNQSLEIMRNFAGTDKFQKELQGQTMDQFAENQLAEINKLRDTAEQAIDAPLSQEDVDNLLIDVRMGGGRERAARRILESKNINVDAMLKANEQATKPNANE